MNFNSANPPTTPVWGERARELDTAILLWHNQFPGDFQQRVLDRLERVGDCLRWPSAGDDGYGRVTLPCRLGVLNARGDSATVRVHRVALVVTLGHPLTHGWTAGHLCADVTHARGGCTHCANGGDTNRCPHRRCCEPTHLSEQPLGANLLSSPLTLAATHASRVMCPRGHALRDANLRPGRLARGGRGCRHCQRESDALRRAAHRLLGLTREAYRRRFSESRAVAEQLLGPARVEAALAECASRWGYISAHPPQITLPVLVGDYAQPALPGLDGDVA